MSMLRYWQHAKHKSLQRRSSNSIYINETIHNWPIFFSPTASEEPLDTVNTFSRFEYTPQLARLIAEEESTWHWLPWHHVRTVVIDNYVDIANCSNTGNDFPDDLFTGMIEFFHDFWQLCDCFCLKIFCHNFFQLGKTISFTWTNHIFDALKSPRLFFVYNRISIDNQVFWVIRIEHS